MVRNILIIIFFSLYSLKISSQSLKIQIIDSISGQAVPYSNIYFSNNNGLISDEDGSFELIKSQLSDKDSMHISMLGYKKSSFLIKDFNDTLIKLIQSPIKLSNVILTNKKLIEIYFYGALMGGLFFVISYNIFPVFKNAFSPLIGSSAAVYAVLIFACSYMPNTRVNLIFFDIKLKYLGLFYVLLSLIQIPFSNAGGNIAHLGGAFFGFYYAKNFNLSNSPFDFIVKFIINFKSKAKENPDNQKKIDNILDKISKSGYESLSKSEKDFLFKNSDND